MTLTIPSPALLLQLTTLGLLAYLAWRLRSAERKAEEVLDAQKATRGDIAILDSRATSAANASFERETKILNGFKGILDVTLANNEALKLLCGTGGAIDAGKAGRIKQALRVAQDYAHENNIDPADLGIAELYEEMGGDTP